MKFFTKSIPLGRKNLAAGAARSALAVAGKIGGQDGKG